jgi:hypothetical protein
VEQRTDGFHTDSGYVFALSPDAVIGRLGHPVPIEQMLQPNHMEMAEVDVASGQIVAVTCLPID